MRAGAVVDYKGASDSRSLEFLKSLGRRGAAAINLGLHSYEFTLEALNGAVLCCQDGKDLFRLFFELGSEQRSITGRPAAHNDAFPPSGSSRRLYYLGGPTLAGLGR